MGIIKGLMRLINCPAKINHFLALFSKNWVDSTLIVVKSVFVLRLICIDRGFKLGVRSHVFFIQVDGRDSLRFKFILIVLM